MPCSLLRGAPQEASPENLRAYMSAGMDGCVSKPLDMTALLNTIAGAPCAGCVALLRIGCGRSHSLVDDRGRAYACSGDPARTWRAASH